MPPTLFFLLSFPVTQLAHALFPAALANGAISGAFVFCKLRVYFLCVSLTLNMQTSSMIQCITRTPLFFSTFVYF